MPSRLALRFLLVTSLLLTSALCACGAPQVRTADTGRLDGGSAIDAALAPIAPGDLLLVSPDTIRLAVGEAACLSIVLRRSTGERDDLGQSEAVQLEVRDPGIAQPTRERLVPECGALHRIMAVAPGTTRVDVSLAVGGERREFAVPVEVLSAPLVLGFVSSGSPLALGGSRYTTFGRERTDLRVLDVQLSGGTGARKIPALFEASVHGESVSVERTEAGAWWHGVALGPSTVVLSYPRGSAFAVQATHTLDVIAPASAPLDRGEAVFLRFVGGEPAPDGARLTPGRCVVAQLARSYRIGSEILLAPVTDGVTWSIEGSSVELGADGAYCGVRDGASTIVGCVDGACARASVDVVLRELTAVEIVADEGLVLEPTGAAIMGARYCIPSLAVRATYGDGGSEDVTNDPTLVWSGRSPSTSLVFSELVPTAGGLCFRVGVVGEVAGVTAMTLSAVFRGAADELALSVRVP